MKTLVVAVTILAGLSCAQAFNWTAYYDVDGIYEWLESMAAAYPDNVELIDIGNSYENRSILGLKIFGDYSSTNRDIMIEAGIHAREWITPAATTYFINQLLTSSNETILNLKNAVNWHIFPTVNPDGYQYTHTTERLWRKTRSVNQGFNQTCYGSDGNRNFDYNWNKTGVSSDPCDYTYPGNRTFSEVEYQRLSEYILSLGDNLIGYIGLHSDEQSVFVPYSDSTEHVPNYDDMVTAAKKFMAYAATVNGTVFAGPATADEISYPASGMSPDWVYYALGTNFSYTIELRGDNFHWPAELIYVQGDEFTQMMLGLVDAITELGYLYPKPSVAETLRRPHFGRIPTLN